MPLLARKKILLAKVEGTYGNDPTPDGTNDAIQTSDMSITPLAGPTVSRNLDRANFGGDLQIQAGQFVELSFMVEVAGGGAVDTAPPWAVLVGACGFDETVNASTSVEYDPVSASIDSVTLYFHHDGQLHKLTGARGTFSIAMDAGTLPKFNFSFTGLYNAPSSTSDPTPVLSAFQTVVPVNNANTTTFDLHSVGLTVSAFNIDIGNEVVYRNVVGSETVEIVDRAVVGSVTFEAPAISTKSWFATALASTTGALQVIHGTATGNIVTIDAPNVQVISPTYDESDGISMITANLSMVPGSGGNDEIQITTT